MLNLAIDQGHSHGSVPVAFSSQRSYRTRVSDRLASLTAYSSR
jgi:hypothetical protein